MTNSGKLKRALELIVEIISILLANLLSYILFDSSFISKVPDFEIEYWMGYAVIIALSLVIVFFCFPSPINITKRNRIMEIVSALRNCAITFSLIAVMLIVTKNRLLESRYLLFGDFIFYCIFSLNGRYILKRAMLHYLPNSKHATMVGVITTVERGNKFIPDLLEDWSKNVKAVALVDTICENGIYKQYKTINGNGSIAIKSELEVINDIAGVPVVANASSLMGWIRTASLDEVYINLPYSGEAKIPELIEELEDMGITVKINLPTLETIVQNSKFGNVDCEVNANCPMAVFSPAVFKERDLQIKKIFDIVGGIVGSIVSLPVILITAIPLLIESPGPLIFKQQRVGKNGRIFDIYKLRSMYVDAEERKKALMEQNTMNGHMFKIDDDPRITKVGKIIRSLSIDELPQFWNVVRGDMSLIGTRPPTIDEFEKYESHHKRRLSLKPGITGMWQVSGRSNIQDFEEIVKLDCEYIDNWSLWLDLKIFFKTIWVLLTRKGAK